MIIGDRFADVNCMRADRPWWVLPTGWFADLGSTRKAAFLIPSLPDGGGAAVPARRLCQNSVQSAASGGISAALTQSSSCAYSGAATSLK